MLQEIAQYIEDHVPGWTIGVNLFVGFLPQIRSGPGGVPVPDRCAVLLENTPGAVDGQLPDRVDKEIQIWNRAGSYFTARGDAYSFYRFLHGMAGAMLPVITSGEHYLAMVIDAVASPAPIANPDERKLFVFSTNYIFRIEDPY